MKDTKGDKIGSHRELFIIIQYIWGLPSLRSNQPRGVVGLFRRRDYLLSLADVSGVKFLKAGFHITYFDAFHRNSESPLLLFADAISL